MSLWLIRVTSGVINEVQHKSRPTLSQFSRFPIRRSTIANYLHTKADLSPDFEALQSWKGRSEYVAMGQVRTEDKKLQHLQNCWLAGGRRRAC